jgi:putative ABC transport system permease protein
MTGSGIALGPALVTLLVLLVGLGAAIGYLAGLGVGRAVLTASLRAVLQLAFVSTLIAAVLNAAWATAGFVALMLAVAVITSARRIGSIRTAWPVAAAIAAGAIPVGAAIVLSGVMPLTTVAVLPIAGILIGGAMTAASLAGRRALDELRQRHGEYEAALAIGLLPRDAALEICRPTAGQALVPALDQTRTVGLVTLPGAFVGVMLGGGSAVQAGATQVLVLIALLAVEAVTASAALEFVARGWIQRPI